MRVSLVVVVVALFVVVTFDGVFGGERQQQEKRDRGDRTLSSPWVQVWMGLERTGEQILPDLEELGDHVHDVHSVSYEHFNLGQDATIEASSLLSPVQSILGAMGFETWPMISTYNDTEPHRRPTDIEHLRQAMQKPDVFVANLLAVSQGRGFTGFNIDIEPSGGTAEDGIAYASFLQYVSKALHRNRLRISVDFASWSGVWNWTALAATATDVDQFILMDTYCSSFDTFRQRVDLALSIFPLEKVVFGLETVNPSTGVLFTESDMKERFSYLQSKHVHRVSIWEMPVPSFWWPLLQSLFSSSSSLGSLVSQ